MFAFKHFKEKKVCSFLFLLKSFFFPSRTAVMFAFKHFKGKKVCRDWTVSFGSKFWNLDFEFGCLRHPKVEQRNGLFLPSEF